MKGNLELTTDIKTRWSRKQLKHMLFHNFVGTIADNVIEIGWILCFSLLLDKSAVERITSLFGLNDALWVILSCSYYCVRTALVSTLPKLLAEKGQAVLSKIVKNHIYLVYILLTPFAIFTYYYMERILIFAGVKTTDFSLYLPYMKLSVIAIYFAAPWSILVTSYLRAVGNTKIAMLLDHCIAWSMMFGIFFTTHILHHGILWALIVNMFSNAIPLYWFIINKPIKRFWSSGFEFDILIIKDAWSKAKWELIRRLSPRLAAFIGVSIMMITNPIYLAAKYWISNLAMFLEGWVDSSASLLNSHVSKNFGLNYKDKDIYNDNNYVFKLSFISILISTLIMYIMIYIFLKFLPSSIYQLLINPIVYLLLIIEIVSKTRYYTLLSISRSYRLDLNGMSQVLYAIPTIILTPFLLWLLLIVCKIGFVGIFITGSVVGFIQWLLIELYYKYKL